MEDAPAFRIVAPHFVACIVVGRRSAPIIRFMLAWDVDRIVDYCKRKGWEVQRLDAEDHPQSQ